MLTQEIMHWAIPVPRKLIPGDTIPPIRVEATISEIGELSQNIEHAFPNQIPLLSN